jgi:hypothetical protein
MVKPRSGRSSLGCLFVLLILAATAYFGIPIGEAFIRYYRYEDAMRQGARFARINSDAVIRSRLRAVADSLELPPEAKAVAVRRYAGDRIVINAEYVVEFELPGMVRLHTFTPRAEGRY